MRSVSLLMALAASLAVLSCNPADVEPTHEPGEYSHTLAVINENYVEPVVLSEITSVAPLTVTSAQNIPYWLSVKAAEDLNQDNHPVLEITVKKEAGMAEDRKADGKVTLSSGDVINLSIHQGADLPTGLNDGGVLTSSNTEFEADWASCKNISLVSSSVDVNGRTQITTFEVALPWATGSLTEEWLPEGEAESMVWLKDQWELVFNLTGILSRPNYNYFGLYNKYTGKLRVFYYMDAEHMPSSGANDHMWSLYFADALAEYPVFQYGIPYNVNISNKYKQLVGSPNIQYMTSATTSQMSQTYKVTPRVGWWAYDIDLSQLRPTAMLSKNGYITPGMMLFNQDNVFLSSIVKGDIEGSISGKINLKALIPAGVNTAGLVFADIAGIASSFAGAGSMSSLIAGTAQNKALPYVQSAVMAAFTTFGMMGSQINKPGPSDKDHLGEIKMDARLNLNAEIESQGFIGGERSTLVSSPKIPKEYIKPDTHLGEGVWNIENHPVIYIVKDVFWSGIKNFIAYEKGEEKDKSGKVIRTYYKVVKDPSLLNLRLVSFMDPTSIGNIFINNNVYSANAPLEVTQSFGTYPGTTHGYTRSFREGLGVSSETAPITNGAFDTGSNNQIKIVKRPVDDGLFMHDVPEEYASILAPRLSQQADLSNPDLISQFFGQSLYYSKVSPDISEVDQVQYVADPQVKLPFSIKIYKNDKDEQQIDYHLYDPDYVDWVVTVTLKITQDETSYFFSRPFIPEVKIISYKDIPALIQQMNARKGQIPAHVNFLDVDSMIERVQSYYNAISE